MSHSALSKILLLMLLTMVLPAMVTAQNTDPRPSKPQKRLDWPRTFGGQPDFEFERAETFTELNKAAQAQGLPALRQPQMKDLLEDRPLNPMSGLVALPSTTLPLTGTAPTTSILPEMPAPANLGALPDMPMPELQDMSEFTTALAQAVSTFMEDWQPDLSRYSLDYLLGALKLQTVSTSPVRYAVINGQRYQVGDRFTLPLTVAPTDVELIEVMQRQLPAAGSLPDVTMAKYEEAFDAAVQQLALDREKNPERYQTSIPVPVTVVDIESRKVFVLLNGGRHELSVKYAL